MKGISKDALPREGPQRQLSSHLFQEILKRFGSGECRVWKFLECFAPELCEWEESSEVNEDSHLARFPRFRCNNPVRTDVTLNNFLPVGTQEKEIGRFGALHEM